MTWRLGGLIGALALCLLAWPPSAAQANHGDRVKVEKHYEHDRHQGDYRWKHGYAKHRHGYKNGHGYRAHGYRGYGRPYRWPRHGRHGARKFVYDDGHCRTTYKYGKHGFKHTVRCRDREFHGRRSGRYQRHGSGYGRGGDVIVVQPHYVAQTLESGADGQAIVWNEPLKQARYEIVPSQSYRAGNGRYCREYLNTATVGGQTRQVYGRACRQEDGSWELVR